MKRIFHKEKKDRKGKPIIITSNKTKIAKKTDELDTRLKLQLSLHFTLNETRPGSFCSHQLKIVEKL